LASVTLGLNLAGSSSAVDLDQQGLTGLWCDLATSGQGLGLEVFPDFTAAGHGLVFGSWFTYDTGASGGAEKQRWYTFLGAMASGAADATLTLYQNTGGNFNAAPVTTDLAIGVGTLSFTSCTTGQFTYQFTDGSARSGVITLTRLMPNVVCSASTARPINTDFALSGNWGNLATSGQGFFVEQNPNVPYLFFAWYTYAPNGQQIGGAASQRWYTGESAYAVGARSIVVKLYETTGGIFDTAGLPTASSAVVGSAILGFAGCSDATLTYSFTSGTNAGLSGTVPLTRIGPTPAACMF
jgi:hypothetical protein